MGEADLRLAVLPAVREMLAVLVELRALILRVAVAVVWVHSVALAVRRRAVQVAQGQQTASQALQSHTQAVAVVRLGIVLGLQGLAVQAVVAEDLGLLVIQ